MGRLETKRNMATTSKLMESVPLLSQRCNGWMVKFAGDVIKQVTEIYGPPPCKFAAVARGSMANWETTSYRDLEFLILIENEDSISYYEELVITAHFIIGNLQETKIKYMGIDELSRDDKWFEDASISGFRIDGLQKNAGNIPLGNGTQDQNNKFIQTVDGMVKVYEQIFLHPDPEKSKISDLSAMLLSTVLLYGDCEMYEDFVRKISVIKPSSLRLEASVKMLQSDAMKFDYQPDDMLTHIKDVKKDFYRFSSTIIFDLKIPHGVQVSSVWETIDCLVASDVLPPPIGHDLSVGLSISMFARLSA